MERIAYVSGSFDPPHHGHDRLIERVKDMGFIPVMDVHSDSFIREYKHREPFTSADERKAYLEKLGVEVRFVNKGDHQKSLLDIKPHVIVVGTDWLRPEILDQLEINEDFMDQHNIGLLILSRTKNISSREIREGKINETSNNSSMS